jgi:hypothetical protein
LCESTTDTQEQTSPDRATKRDELDVSRFQPRSQVSLSFVLDSEVKSLSLPSRDITIFFGSRDITIDIHRLAFPRNVPHPGLISMLLDRRRIIVDVLLVFVRLADVDWRLLHFQNTNGGTWPMVTEDSEPNQMVLEG